MSLDAAEMQQLPFGCHALIPGIGAIYGYVPSLGAGIAFCVLFGLSTLGHLAQTVRLRHWTSLVLAVGAITELLGWAARTWNAKCPYNENGYLMQICTLIIGPTFFSAALYLILGSLINNLGRRSSVLSAPMYAIVFCTCDVISLVVQAVGGGMAAVATKQNSGSGDAGANNAATKPGTNIMVAGIAFQLFTLTLFAGLFLDFLRRTRRLDVARHYWRPLAASVISFLMIYIRSVYRTVELAQGWVGYLIQHEGYFIGFDGALMVVAVGIFLVLPPIVRPLAEAPSGSEHESRGKAAMS